MVHSPLSRLILFFSSVNFWGVKEMSNQKTRHCLVQGDARDLTFIPDESIHLVVTSLPYWVLKKYREHPSQMGHIEDYDTFIGELSKVWQHCYRILVPGGRLVCVVGDVCLSRRKHGRHVVVPLHSDIAVSCRKIGFDNLNPIIWFKIAKVTYEVNNGTKFFGNLMNLMLSLKRTLNLYLCNVNREVIANRPWNNAD